ncbi:MAG: hypothetical protein ACREM6_02740 [Vulcanimicrobiaceae bacterium]
MQSLPPPKNVTPSPVPSVVRRLAIPLLVLVVMIIVVSQIHHVSPNERLAAAVTVALQHNDLTTVQSDANAESRLHITRAIVGKAADEFAPLGNLRRVVETTPSTEADKHVHTFHLIFQHGQVDEQLQLDGDGKIFHFHYNPPVLAKP